MRGYKNFLRIYPLSAQAQMEVLRADTCQMSHLSIFLLFFSQVAGGDMLKAVAFHRRGTVVVGTCTSKIIEPNKFTLSGK